MARRALDQSSRYADLSLDEQTLIRNGPGAKRKGKEKVSKGFGFPKCCSQQDHRAGLLLGGCIKSCLVD